MQLAWNLWNFLIAFGDRELLRGIVWLIIECDEGCGRRSSANLRLQLRQRERGRRDLLREGVG